jgi:hypothetical protein
VSRDAILIVVFLVGLGGCDAEVEGLVPDGGDLTPMRGPARGPVFRVLDAGDDAVASDAAADDAVASDVAAGDFDAGDAGVARLEDANQLGYQSFGVVAYLGVNPCSGKSGWDPATGECYPATPASATGGVCGKTLGSQTLGSQTPGSQTLACGTYAPGALLVWSSTDPRFRYLDDPSGGYVCLPNDVLYVVPC